MIANVVSISGGKDSAATGLLAIERGTKNLRFVFADTGHEHALTYQYVEYLSGVFERLCGVGIDTVRADFTQRIADRRLSLATHLAEITAGVAPSNKRLKGYTPTTLERMIGVLGTTGSPFLDLSLMKGRFPSTRARFCSEELKHAPLNKYTEGLMGDFDAVVSWQGVRRDESKERAELPEKDVEFGAWGPKPSGLLIYRPILDWKAEDCFAQHEKFGVEPNPLYKMGMGRVGCMPCIHATKPEMREITQRFPEVIDRMASWEEAVSTAAKRGCSTFMDGRVTSNYLGTTVVVRQKDGSMKKTYPGIDYRTHGIHTYAKYAKTKRGGRAGDEIPSVDITEQTTCSSIYGLCE